MAVVDRNGWPIGLHLDSAQPHELTLAEVTLQTIAVPRKRAQKSWWQTKLMTVPTFVASCIVAASSPPFRPVNGASAKSPSGVVLSEQEQATAHAGKSSSVLPGWITVVARWYAIAVICISTVRFVSLPSSSSALTEFRNEF